jgi:conflict system STAND superfamily ATPase
MPSGDVKIKSVEADLLTSELRINDSEIVLKPRSECKQCLLLAYLVAFSTKYRAMGGDVVGLTWKSLSDFDDRTNGSVLDSWGFSDGRHFSQVWNQRVKMPSSWIPSQIPGSMKLWLSHGEGLLGQLFRATPLTREERHMTDSRGRARRMHLPSGVSIAIVPDAQSVTALVTQLNELQPQPSSDLPASASHAERPASSASEAPPGANAKDSGEDRERRHRASQNVVDVFFPPAAYTRILRSLSRERPVLMVGESGEGKTYTAEEILLATMEQGKGTRWCRKVGELARAYESCDSEREFFDAWLPLGGVLLLDDIFGKNRYDELPERVFELIFRLCCLAPGRRTSVLMTSRSSLLRKYAKPLSELRKLNVEVFDLSSRTDGVTMSDRLALFSILLEKNSRTGHSGETSFDLVSSARALVRDMSMSLLEVSHWASLCISSSTEKTLEESAKALVRNLFEAEVSGARLSRFARAELVRVSLFQGAPIKDVEATVAAAIRHELSPVWRKIFVAHGESELPRLELRHPCIEEYLIQYARDNRLVPGLAGWLKDGLSSSSVKVRLAALTGVFRLRTKLGTRFLECLDVAMGDEHDGIIYRLVDLLAIAIERRADPALVARFQRLLRKGPGSVTGRCIVGIIRGWRQMPPSLKVFIDRAISDNHEGSSRDAVLENCLEEVIVQMAKRPSMFSERLEKLFRDRDRKSFYGELALTCLVRSEDVEDVEEIRALAGLVGPVLPLPSKLRLQAEIRGPQCALSPAARLAVMRELRRGPYFGQW